MKNADDMLKKTLMEVDTNRDGRIQYEGTVPPNFHGPVLLEETDSDLFIPWATEFRIFCRRAERQLYDLFSSIDKDNNGKLDIKELQTAFRSAGLTVSSQRLGEFFHDMDHNKDGYVTFNEWRYVETFWPDFRPPAGCAVTDGARFGCLQKSYGAWHVMCRRGWRWVRDVPSHQLTSHNPPKPHASAIADPHDGKHVTDNAFHRDFLLFMPAREHKSHLGAVLSFYNSVVNVTPEGDSIVSEETLEGLGTASSFRSLIKSLFGSLFRVAFPSDHTTNTPEPPLAHPTTTAAGSGSDGPPRPHDAIGTAGATRLVFFPQDQEAVIADVVPQDIGDGTRGSRQRSSTATAVQTEKKIILTELVPDPGYFLAGAIAGGVSRTATAPLDRIKVYLLVNTSSKAAETAAGSAKQARLASAAKNAARPFKDAIRDILRSGGIKSFFAGEFEFCAGCL